MVQKFLELCFNLLDWLIGLLPNMTFVNDFGGAVNSISNLLYEASAIVPFSDFFICIGAISAFYVALFGVRVINWIIHRIPIFN